MNENVIVIQAVNNGFVVTIPFKTENMYAGLKEVLPGFDPMQKPKSESGILEKTEHVFIFDSMEKVLAFLAERYV